MLWSQELPAYSYTHRLGSLSQGMPYCPFCQNSVPSTRAAPGHAIARKPLPGISKTWPLFEHVNSFQLDKKLTLDWTLEVTRPFTCHCQNTPTPTTPKKKPAFLMSRFARWLSASPRHAADTLTRRFRRSHLKTGFPLQNALIQRFIIWIPVP